MTRDSVGAAAVWYGLARTHRVLGAAAEESAALDKALGLDAQFLPALSAAGLGTPGTERFGHAIDLLLGKRQIFLQQPKYFFFPELPQIQFFERQLFPWASALERAVDDIRAEAREVLEASDGFVPYLQRDPDRPTFDPGGLLDNPDWGAYFLIKNGATVDENAARVWS
ncbi:MAG: hypothetical protein WA807_00810 [Steroidobacteraceae bacterium]